MIEKERCRGIIGGNEKRYEAYVSSTFVPESSAFRASRLVR